MAKAMKCDICGRYFEVKDVDHIYGWIHDSLTFDICSECGKTIEDYIKSLEEATRVKPKTTIKHSCLNVVTYKGYLYLHDTDSLGKDKEECVVTVVLNKNGQVNKICSIITDDWEYKCEVEHSMKEVQDLAGNTYHCKTEKCMWYKRRLNQPYDGWVFCPNIAYLEYQI